MIPYSECFGWDGFKRLLPTDSDLDSLFDAHRTRVDELLAAGTQSVTPYVFVLYRPSSPEGVGELSSALVVVQGSFNEDEEKQAIMIAIGEDFYERRLVPLAVSLCTEVWISEQSGEQPSMRPADDPNRKEAILVQSLTVAKAPRIEWLNVIRDRNQRLARAGEWSRLPADERFEMNLLQMFFVGLARRKSSGRGGHS